MAATKTTTVTVDTTAPLMVLADGADTPCPAVLQTGVTTATGERVQVTVRTPEAPLITGKESA